MNRFLMPKAAITAITAFAFTATGLATFIPASSWAATEAAAAASADTGSAPAGQGHLVGLAFGGRSVSNLDRSIAFYEALGFRLDPAAPPVWRREEVFQRIDGIANARGVTTRMAKMYVDEPAGGRFVIYLRELKGIPRRNLSNHTAWEPGASHFGLVVADAQALWSRLEAHGMLHALSWGGQLIAPPGQKKGMIAYITDPDGIDIEIIDQRPASPAVDGRPARPALVPGVNHVGLVVLDSAKARAFYGDLLGGRLVSTESPWMHGDFYDAAVGGHGNILRFFNQSFPAAFEARLAGSDPTLASPAPGSRINLELVEFQNRKKPVAPARITDIGVGYVGFEVQGLDAFLARAQAGGARLVSDGIVTMRGSGTRVAMVRDPDVGGFVELFEEHPRH
jgi:catechol 2,3-dioxygenase-like lactoylglutathione lyase family enzyme